MPCSFRLATQADLDSILPLMHQLQADDPWSEPFDPVIARQNLSALFDNSGYGVVYLACTEESTIGYLVICFDFSLEYRGKGAWIDELFVQPSYRGQGIGTQFLDLAASASREHGAQYLHLEVNHGNRAVELYRHRGFVDHQRYLMTKSLTALDKKA
jgi:GNAT superfamily N-acetyltransferase